jgi:acetyl-CoA carboxylase biotin carboxyl carrier protein
MMDVKDVKKLLDAVAGADVSELTYETGDVRITVKRGVPPELVAAPAPVAQPAPQAPAPAAPPAQPSAAPSDAGGPEATPEAVDAAPHLAEVTAPIVGTFYASPAPDAAPYVKVGDHVAAGTVLCIIEAMKLMNEIETETSGTVTEILVRNEEPVEYGQVLFRIDPD